MHRQYHRLSVLQLQKSFWYGQEIPPTLVPGGCVQAVLFAGLCSGQLTQVQTVDAPDMRHAQVVLA
jgi:hypothetical protein